MARIYFITHPEVVIDKKADIRSWPLSEKGVARIRKMLKQPWIKNIKSVFSSTEQKAVDGAEMLAEHLRLKNIQVEELGENDRSSTGFLEPDEFWSVVKEFYGNPEKSIRGWERAIDVQTRIVGAVENVISQAPPGDVAIVSHGGSGAMLLCHLKRVPISQKDDQPGAGGGNYFVFDRKTKKVIHGWKLIDKLNK